MTEGNQVVARCQQQAESGAVEEGMRHKLNQRIGIGKPGEQQGCDHVEVRQPEQEAKGRGNPDNVSCAA